MLRCAELNTRLKKLGISSALYSKPENIRYLTGYTGEGCLLVTDGQPVIFTDFRYIEQAARQAPGVAVVRTRGDKSVEALISEHLHAAGKHTLAVETGVLTHDEYTALEAAMNGIVLTSLPGISEEMRTRKDAGEIDAITKAAAIACKAFDELLGWVRPGMTEKQVQTDLDYAMARLGSEKVAFDTIACAGPNGSLPHAIPSDRPIQSGELLTLDFGAQVNGYKSDMTRTIGIGTVSAPLRAMYNTVLEAQTRVLDQIGPGKICSDMDAIARTYLDEKYPGAFGHGLGHGVGLFIHEYPRLSKNDSTVLAPGHVVTVEPGVYVPGLGGCRIEDMVIITDEGYQNPITAPKKLIEI